MLHPPVRQRRPRRLDPAHLAWVRQQPCVVCGRTAGEAHHIIGQGRGAMGSKADDYETIPLCRTHHTELHEDVITWELAHGPQIRHVIATLVARLIERHADDDCPI